MENERDIRILLVDDDPADVERTLEVLRRRCLANAVRVARGGREAIDYLCGHGQFAARRRHPLPDVVLLDLNMPGTDGFEVLRQVRIAQCLRGIPVIALCTSEEEGERAMRCEFRANQYLVKPLTFEGFSDLSRKIGNWTLRLDLPERYAASRPEWTTRPPCSRIEWNSIFGQISRAAFSSS
ncbi:MAG: response regulator [Usitatibacter sp.]